MLGTLAIGLLFWLGVSFVRRHPRRAWCLLVYIAFGCAVVLSGNAVRSIVARRWHFAGGDTMRLTGVGPVYAAVIVVSIVGLTVMALWPRQIVRVAYRAFLVAFPLVPLLYVQAVWAMVSFDATRFADRPAAPALAASAGRPRVLWIVFDEMDQNIAFDGRPRDLQLPELDRFRAQSIYTSKSYSPDAATSVSLPSLINGSKLLGFRPSGPDRMAVLFDGTSGWQDNWNPAGTIFGEARRMGFNTALVGWYIPYCRMLSAELTRCWWCEIERQMNSGGETLSELVFGQARMLFETSVLSPFGQSLVIRQKARHYSEMMNEAMAVAADASIGLGLLHMDVPHAPFIYDRRARAMTLANAPVQGYADSLALVDLTLGRLRERMQAAGLWDSTTVIVTSDHFNRDGTLFHGTIDRRVPFMIKMPGQTTGEVFDRQLNTIVTRRLITYILGGRLSTPGQVVEWLAGNRSTIIPALPSGGNDN
jgi:hypothetical protein